MNIYRPITENELIRCLIFDEEKEKDGTLILLHKKKGIPTEPGPEADKFLADFMKEFGKKFL